MENSHRGIWDIYIKSWSDADVTRRLQFLEQSVSPQCVYTDPLVQAQGHKALSDCIGELHNQLPGGKLVTTAFDTHHDQCFASWDIVDGKGATVISGHSFARAGADGRLLTMTGFFPTPPAG